MHNLAGPDFVPKPPRMLQIRSSADIIAERVTWERERQEWIQEENRKCRIFLSRRGDDKNLWMFVDNYSYAVSPATSQQICWRITGGFRERVRYTEWGWVSDAEMREAKSQYENAKLAGMAEEN
ncbi:MAG: hypothetical protein AAB790_02155 [Patescibacteria group bacterium]